MLHDFKLQLFIAFWLFIEYNSKQRCSGTRTQLGVSVNIIVLLLKKTFEAVSYHGPQKYFHEIYILLISQNENKRPNVILQDKGEHEPQALVSSQKYARYVLTPTTPVTSTAISHVKIAYWFLLLLQKTINVLMFTFRRMPGKMFPNL